MKKFRLLKNKDKEEIVFAPIRVKMEFEPSTKIKHNICRMQNRALFSLRKLEKKCYLKSIGFYGVAGVASLSLCAFLTFFTDLPMSAVIGATVGTFLPGTFLGVTFSRFAAKIDNLQKAIISDNKPCELEKQIDEASQIDVCNALRITKDYFTLKEKPFFVTPFEEFDNTKLQENCADEFFARVANEFDTNCKRVTEKPKENQTRSR